MEQDSGQNQVLFVSMPEAARQLGIGKTLLYEQIHAGKFPHRRIGGRIVESVRVPVWRTVATAHYWSI
jgi:excisionase family DNA binding protein